MSPEIVELNTSTTEYSFPSDIWSFGVILYCILSRKQKEVNFRSDAKKFLIKKNIESLEYRHSAKFIELIELCLDNDPSKRPTAQELLKKFQSFQENFESLDFEIEELSTDDVISLDLNKSFKF
jgi:serine/threonine-protein kinase OSR1/STK39